MTTQSIAVPTGRHTLTPIVVVLMCVALLAILVVSLTFTLGGGASGAAHGIHSPASQLPQFLTRIGRPQ